jgi:hypothetical protein
MPARQHARTPAHVLTSTDFLLTSTAGYAAGAGSSVDVGDGGGGTSVGGHASGAEMGGGSADHPLVIDADSSVSDPPVPSPPAPSPSATSRGETGTLARIKARSLARSSPYPPSSCDQCLFATPFTA